MFQEQNILGVLLGHLQEIQRTVQLEQTVGTRRTTTNTVQEIRTGSEKVRIFGQNRLYIETEQNGVDDCEDSFDLWWENNRFLQLEQIPTGTTIETIEYPICKFLLGHAILQSGLGNNTYQWRWRWWWFEWRDQQETVDVDRIQSENRIIGGNWLDKWRLEEDVDRNVIGIIGNRRTTWIVF